LKHKVKLGINVDHIATLRQARGEGSPDLLNAVIEVISAGADSIVAHLREDRRHIQDADIYSIRKAVKHFDMEMAATKEMVGIALKVMPDIVTLVPEKRQELTTEGGLDVAGNLEKLIRQCGILEKAGIRVSLFIDPEPIQIEASARTGATFIEIHTGKYANDPSPKNLRSIEVAVLLATELGLKVNAGHGLDYKNTKAVAKIEGIEEFNIGFSVIARSVFVGLKTAVKEMKHVIISAVLVMLFCANVMASTSEVRTENAMVPLKDLPKTIDFNSVDVNALDVTPEASKPVTKGPATKEVKSVDSASSPETTIIKEVSEASKEVKKEVPINVETILVTPTEIVAEVQPKKPYFSDVPQDHWAFESVNDLVRLGVTQGYPDGTYRGSSNLSRYEMAMFLSKLAHAKQVRAAVSEKLMEELRAELYKIRYSLNMYKKQPSVQKLWSGSYFGRLRLGNILAANASSASVSAPFGPVFDQRLQIGFDQPINDDSYLKFKLDTMDAAITPGRDVFKEMLDFKGRVMTKSGFGIEATGGPGIVVHHESTAKIFPCDDGTVYMRENGGIKFMYEPGDLETSIGYRSTNISNLGYSTGHDVYTSVAYLFRGTWFGNMTLTYSADNFRTDLRAVETSNEATVSSYELLIEPNGRLEYGIKTCVVGGLNNPNNLYVGIHIMSKDFLRAGSSFKVMASKTGSEFFAGPVYSGYLGETIFNRLYQSGSYYTGFEFEQAVSKGLSVKMSGDLTMGSDGIYGNKDPLSRASLETDIEMGVLERATLVLAYRLYQVPSSTVNQTSDMLGVGLKYGF
jgi:pyridoxine 5-phosphate synthase